MKFPPKIGYYALIAYGLLAAGVGMGKDGPMQKYKNERFGFSLEYPQFLRGEGESMNGDGQNFETPLDTSDGSGQLRMLVYGSHNGTGASIEQMRAEFEAESSPNRKITQSVVSVPPEQWYIVAGTEEKDVFYRKVLLKGPAVVVTLHFTYPAAMKDRYNPYVAATQRSLQ